MIFDNLNAFDYKKKQTVRLFKIWVAYMYAGSFNNCHLIKFSQ